MNGYVLAWMALSGSACGAAGVLAGRKFEWAKTYRLGFEAGEVQGAYDARQKQQASALSDAQYDRWQRMAAGELVPDDPRPVGAHGHPGPCSQDRGCW